VSPTPSDDSLLARLRSLPPGERAAAVEDALAQDESLRDRLPEIMAALGLDPPPPLGAGELSPEAIISALEAALEIPPNELSGTRIGPYKLLQEIGRGGFGVVWMAEQESPIRRRVALKIIKAGMDSKEVVARFEAERQALALMDHPNIARVLDAGTTDAGRPFFVMELVRGLPITQYCDENRLPVADRLRLFILVCQAVQHAHQKGIIHRDLKPTNILVTLHDGVPIPKVIDFGIAKATRGPLTEKTFFTQFHAFIGTPAYTSPEQMEMSGLDIDTRSDIYSLGVLLYELLTGKPPFDAGVLARAGLEAMRRTIREVDPPRPSHRLITLTNEDRVSVAHHRGTEAGRLSVLVNGDLDWIVMRCLEKDRTRRYETANGLARDIQRHMENEPVAARPPSAAYVLRKLVRRYRLVFIGAAIIAVVLVVGLVATSWEMFRATRAERVADLERAKAVAERTREEDLLLFMFGDLRARLNKVGRLDVLDSVGSKAIAYFDLLDPHDVSDTALLVHSKALTQIGEDRIHQKNFPEAAAVLAQAYERAAALSARHPRDTQVLFQRGQTEYWIGFLHGKTHEYPAAIEWMTRYRDTSAALVALEPAQVEWHSELAYGEHNLAAFVLFRNDLAQADAMFLAELSALNWLQSRNATDDEVPDRIADVHGWLGNIAERQGKFAEAVAQHALQATELTQLVEAEPDNPSRRGNLVKDCLFHQVDLDLVLGNLASAEERLRQARRLTDALVAYDSKNKDWLSASLHERLEESVLDHRQGDDDSAARLVHEVRPRLEAISAAAPADHQSSLWLGRAWRLEAQLLAPKDLPAAAEAARRGVEIGEAFVRQDDLGDDNTSECAAANVVAALIADQAGARDRSAALWRRAAELLAPRLQGTRDWRLLDPAARALIGTGQPAKGAAIISELTQWGYVPLEPWPGQSRPPLNLKPR
jgi:serine/threonine protein kinase